MLGQRDYLDFVCSIEAELLHIPVFRRNCSSDLEGMSTE